jgi:hypothetical protein
MPSPLIMLGIGGGRQPTQLQSYQECQRDVAQKLRSDLILRDAIQDAPAVQATSNHAFNLGEDAEAFEGTAAAGSHSVKSALPNCQAHQIQTLLLGMRYLHSFLRASSVGSLRPHCRALLPGSTARADPARRTVTAVKEVREQRMLTVL